MGQYRYYDAELSEKAALAMAAVGDSPLRAAVDDAGTKLGAALLDDGEAHASKFRPYDAGEPAIRPWAAIGGMRIGQNSSEAVDAFHPDGSREEIVARSGQPGDWSDLYANSFAARGGAADEWGRVTLGAVISGGYPKLLRLDLAGNVDTFFDFQGAGVLSDGLGPMVGIRHDASLWPGGIHVRNREGQIITINSAGSIGRTITLSLAYARDFCVDNYGNLYIGTSHAYAGGVSRVGCWAETGTYIWLTDLPATVANAYPRVAWDMGQGVCLATSGYNRLYCVADGSGAIRWSWDTPTGWRLADVAADGAGSAYVLLLDASSAGYLQKRHIGASSPDLIWSAALTASAAGSYESLWARCEVAWPGRVLVRGYYMNEAFAAGDGASIWSFDSYLVPGHSGFHPTVIGDLAATALPLPVFN